jgi:outer membrane protein OmpA-like peptidoglycan-associated protein
MSEINQDDDQHYVLGIVGAIILAILVGVVSLSISVSTQMNESLVDITNAKNQYPIQLGNFDFLVTDGKITLTGEVVDDTAKMSLLRPAQLLWGTDNVIDQVNIVPTAKRFWWSTKPFDVLSKLKSVPQFALHLAENEITGSAKVGSEIDKDFLSEGLKSWFTLDATNQVNIEVDSQYLSNPIGPNTLLNVAIEYGTGVSEIPEDAKPILNQIAEILKDDGRLIYIHGHTDNVGIPEENKTLSQLRAEKIKSYLVTQGVTADNLRADGLGDTQPIKDNLTQAGRSMNRRIEFSTQ